MKRGDNITLLMKKTEEMGDISLTNFNKTKELKKKMDWEELKTKLIYVVAVLVYCHSNSIVFDIFGLSILLWSVSCVVFCLIQSSNNNSKFSIL